jgi:N-acetyl-gamma-glutamylphosphate reductase
MNALRTLYEAEKSRTVVSAVEPVKKLVDADKEHLIPEEIYDPYDDSKLGNKKAAKNATYGIPEEKPQSEAEETKVAE